jgi:YVTN family beta-propeller protein
MPPTVRVARLRLPLLVACAIAAGSCGAAHASGPWFSASTTRPHVRYIVDMPAPPTGVGFAFGSAWVTLDKAQVVRVDPRTNAIVATIGVQNFPVRAVAGFGSLWVTNCGSGSVSRIDPKTDKVIATVTTGDCPFGAAALGQAVWVVNADDHVSRIDPKANTVTNIRLPLTPCATASVFPYRHLTTGAGALWVATPRGRVVRLDPSTGHVTATIRVAPPCSNVGGVTVGFGSVWASVDGTSSQSERAQIVRIDLHTLKVTARIRSRQGQAAEGVAYRGRAWFGHGDNAASILEEIDPATNRIVATIKLGDYAGNVVTGAGSLWAEAYKVKLLYRIAPGS